ncbi:MAG TPA: hypothetical protein VFZ10_17535 [Geminicoccaceae bacterium]
MALNSIELCSSALIKLGADSISSFEDGTAEARVAARLYPLVRDALLCAHPWSFATKKTELARLAATPATDFAHAYQLPNDFLQALSAGDAGRGRGLTYQIVNRQLHTDAEAVVLCYLFRPSEGDFPAYFVPALVTRLAAEFCLPVTENTSRADRFTRLAEDELKLARLIDSQQDTPAKVEDFTLIAARLG